MEEHFENIQLNIDQLPSIGDLNFKSLESKYFSVMLFNSTIFYLLLIGAMITVWVLDKEGNIKEYFQWALLVLLTMFLLNLFLLYKSFQFKAYAFRQKDISYKSGWLWRKITTVPFNRVQHCEVSQGVIDRYFGLSKIKIFTAGGSSSDVSIPGLLPDEAEDLKSFILEKVVEYE